MAARRTAARPSRGCSTWHGCLAHPWQFAPARPVATGKATARLPLVRPSHGNPKWLPAMRAFPHDLPAHARPAPMHALRPSAPEPLRATAAASLVVQPSVATVGSCSSCLGICTVALQCPEQQGAAAAFIREPEPRSEAHPSGSGSWALSCPHPF